MRQAFGIVGKIAGRVPSDPNIKQNHEVNIIVNSVIMKHKITLSLIVWKKRKTNERNGHSLIQYMDIA